MQRPQLSLLHRSIVSGRPTFFGVREKNGSLRRCTLYSNKFSSQSAQPGSAAATEAAKAAPETSSRLWHTAVGHASNSFFLAAYLAQDMLYLRAISLCGTSLGLFYNCNHKAGVMWLPVFWGSIFFMLNAYRLAELYLRDEVSFSAEELAAYDDIFAQYQITTAQYGALLSEGRSEHFNEGETIDVKGHERAKVLRFVTSGKVVVQGESDAVKSRLKWFSRKSIPELGAGAIIGTIPIDGRPDHEVSNDDWMELSPHTLVAGKGGATVLTLSSSGLHKLMQSDAALHHSMQRLVRLKKVADVAIGSKNEGGDGAADLKSLELYEHLLAACCADDEVVAAEKQMLRKFRQAYGITPQQHEACLGKVGWTMSQWNDGTCRSSLGNSAKMALVRFLEEEEQAGEEGGLPGTPGSPVLAQPLVA